MDIQMDNWMDKCKFAQIIVPVYDLCIVMDVGMNKLKADRLHRLLHSAKPSPKYRPLCTRKLILTFDLDP